MLTQVKGTAAISERVSYEKKRIYASVATVAVSVHMRVRGMVKKAMRASTHEAKAITVLMPGNKMIENS